MIGVEAALFCVGMFGGATLILLGLRLQATAPRAWGPVFVGVVVGLGMLTIFLSVRGLDAFFRLTGN